jgi:xanthine dehydrogenase accessory factor
MNPTDVLDTALRLRERGEPFCLVSVLRVVAPASARAGDKAVVTADGIVQGWIGGGCAQPAVVKTVRQALADGRARTIRIAPAAEGEVRELGDVLEFGMACHSGGTLELFVDPMLPCARLLVVGDTPLAVALAALAPRVGLPVTVLAHGADAARFPDADAVVASDDDDALAQVAPGAFVVVATQGRRDLQGLRAALAVQARRVFFVASARKAQVLKASLLESGHDPAAVEAIVAPAGQPIGAQTPEEIALSVLAAVVAARRAAPGAPAADTVRSPVAVPTSKALPLAVAAEPAAGAFAVAATPPASDARATSLAALPDTGSVMAVVDEVDPSPAAAPGARRTLGSLLRRLPLPEMPPAKGGCCGG